MADSFSVASQNQLSPEAMAATTREVGYFNRTLNNGRELKRILDQEDFLNLLITQLKNQDPTQPMNDRESIAQMAQFSSLEQMQAMRAEISQLSQIMARSQSYGLLGKAVEIADGDELIRGIVQEVTGGDSPQVMVNGYYYSVSDVQRVANMTEEKGE